MAISLLAISLPVACAIRSVRLERRLGDVTQNSVPLEVDEPAPFQGWLVRPADFAYLLRCEDYVEAEGVKVD